MSGNVADMEDSVATVDANAMTAAAKEPLGGKLARWARNLGETLLASLGWFLLFGAIALVIAIGIVSALSHPAKTELAEALLGNTTHAVKVAGEELQVIGDVAESAEGSETGNTALLCTGGSEDGVADGTIAMSVLPVDYEDGIDPWDAANLEHVFSRVPTEVRELLASCGWKVHVVHDVEASAPIPVLDPDLDAVEGEACGFSKEIYVIPAATSFLMEHEIGHAIDWELGFPSLSPEFIGIAATCDGVMAEKDKVEEHLSPDTIGRVTVPSSISEICTRSRINEKWANAFALYCNVPETLLRDYPDCYLHFARIFGVRGIGDGVVERTGGIGTDAGAAIEEAMASQDEMLTPKVELAGSPYRDVRYASGGATENASSFGGAIIARISEIVALSGGEAPESE